MAEEHATRDELVQFLNSIARPGSSVDEVDDGTNLIQQGLIDSFAVIQIISYLEQEHDVNLHTLGIDPTSLSSVGGILSAISRAG